VGECADAEAGERRWVLLRREDATERETMQTMPDDGKRRSLERRGALRRRSEERSAGAASVKNARSRGEKRDRGEAWSTYGV
jgi:hypothetical protein